MKEKTISDVIEFLRLECVKPNNSYYKNIYLSYLYKILYAGQSEQTVVELLSDIDNIEYYANEPTCFLLKDPVSLNIIKLAINEDTDELNEFIDRRESYFLENMIDYSLSDYELNFKKLDDLSIKEVGVNISKYLIFKDDNEINRLLSYVIKYLTASNTLLKNSIYELAIPDDRFIFCSSVDNNLHHFLLNNKMIYEYYNDIR